MQLSAGTRLGPYEIVAPLGKGGMGEVYRAQDTRLRRDVAIKVMQRGHADPSLWDRFAREARAASALSHPNICSIFDTGESDGLPYLVMELLEGQTLRELIGTRPMEPATAVGIAVQIADALEAAHAKGILHRDIKPGNVIIVGRSHVKVLDFGLAKQTAAGESDETATLGMETETGSVVGTPAYLAPEVLQGAKADARSDLWALGVVLYQMLTGELPFKGATTFEISSAILKEAPAPLPAGVPLRLRAIVERCLEKRPERRYQGAGEVRISLEESRTKAKPAAPKRRLFLWAAGAVVLVAIAVAVVWQRQAAGTARTGSTGAPLSVNQEANDLFEVGINAQMVQKRHSQGAGDV
jgi:serine/threonine protein kinase